MVCFKAWIKPTFSFEKTAEIVGHIFRVDLKSHQTTKFDEFLGYEIDFDDFCDDPLHSYEAHIALLGPPENISDLIEKFPDEYSEREKDYHIVVCSHKGLPLQIGKNLLLPYHQSKEMAKDIIEKIEEAGVLFDKNYLPIIIENDEIVICEIFHSKL